MSHRDLFNELQVVETLRKVVSILNQNNITYWMEGSIVPTSVNNAMYREVHDLDILIDKNKAGIFTTELEKLGYRQKGKNMYRVADQLGVRVFEHDLLLDVGYFAISLGKSENEIKAGPLKISIPSDLFTTCDYSFRDIHFNGVSLEVAYTLALLSKDNPKRFYEFDLYKKHNVRSLEWPIYDFYIFGVKCNWLIAILNASLVYIGKLRVLLNKPYDPWQ